MNVAHSIEASSHLREVLAVVRRVKSTTESVYVVGGAVRDLILGKSPTDIDLVVEGDGLRLARALATEARSSLVEHQAFGTASLTIAGSVVDIATARSESYIRPGALPTVRPASIVEDAQRRDITINTLACSLNSESYGEVVDPFNGIADLENKIVRVLHDNSFVDDPTRILRVLRYASRFSFSIDQHTRDLLQRAIDRSVFTTISGDRIGTELVLVWSEPSAGSMQFMQDLKIDSAIDGAWKLNELTVARVRAVDDFANEHELASSAVWRIRAAAALVDMDEAAAKALVGCLKLSRRDSHAIIDAIHAISFANGNSIGECSDVEILRELRSAEGALAARVCAQSSDVRTRLIALTQREQALQLRVNGHDLLAMGLTRGPAVGEVLATLYAQRLEGQFELEADEWAAAESLVRQYQSNGAQV